MKANTTIIYISIFFMIPSFIGYIKAEDLFFGEKVTTLGVSAVIMLMINPMIWPKINEDLQESTRLN